MEDAFELMIRRVVKLQVNSCEDIGKDMCGKDLLFAFCLEWLSMADDKDTITTYGSFLK